MKIKVLAWVLAVPGLVWAVLRLTGWSPGPVVVALPFTPYAAALSLVPLVVALVVRNRAAAVVAALVTVALVGCVGPRVLPDRDRGPRDGVALRVLSANMLEGGADPATIVQLVRDRDVAVLALQEFTAATRSGLTAAGLDQLLPYSSIAPQRATDPFGTTGSAVYSRYPLTGAGFRLNPGGFQQAYGNIRPPGAIAVLVESAHPAAPYALSVLDSWRTDLAAQPVPDPNGPPRILLGDFNATLDHRQLRTLIGRGYRDVAATLGRGLIPSWGPYGEKPIPPITIDHVLADRRLGVTAYATHALPHSDHRLVFAALTLPAA